MSKKKSNKVAALVDFPVGEIFIRRGDVFDADDPIVRKRKGAFGPLDGGSDIRTTADVPAGPPPGSQPRSRKRGG